MVESLLIQHGHDRLPVKEASPRAGIVNMIRPRSMQVTSTLGSFVFTYFPKGMGNDQPGCYLFTGIEIKTSNTVNADEFQLLVKTTIESFPEIMGDAALHKLEKTLENVYNGVHVGQFVKVESIQIVQYDPATDELRYYVTQIECPTCHQKTKVVFSWEVVQARSENPNPIVNMLFKKDKTDCGHTFIAFLDRALKVKGCDAVDM
jgi:hypothetical protein